MIRKLALFGITLSFSTLAAMSITAVRGYEIAGDQSAAKVVIIATVIGLLSIVVLWELPSRLFP